MLPFSREQFLEVFAQYNAAIWPLQWAAVLLGIAIVVAGARPSRNGTRGVDAGLALMWLWTGVLYHGIYFARINTAATAFASLFVIQGGLLVRAAWLGRQSARKPAARPGAWFGWVLVAYALLLYPLVGWVAGHAYPAVPAFGVSPCPVTLFTLGMFLVGAQPVPRHLCVIPALWVLVGGSAAFLLGMPQDWPLLVGGAVAVAMLWRRAPARGTLRLDAR
jgi:hypothetical protein